MRRGTAVLACGFLLGASVGCGGADVAADRSARAQEVDGSQGGGRDVVPADREVLLERADRARVKGDTTAPLRMLEVSDFQCPFCARFNAETLPALDSLYVRTGKIMYVWFSYPNPGHPLAWPAIEAAFCAGAVGRFWPMHDTLFSRVGEWGRATDPSAHFVSYATSLGIDEESYAACLREDRTAPLQVRDYELALRAGISSTPFFVIGEEVAVRGAQPLEAFTRAIDSLLVARAATR